MAVLSDEDRIDAFADFIRDNKIVFGSVVKQDIRAAVNAIDDFLNTNAATLNAAIPQPARGQLTTAQKARLLVYVVLKRWEKGA